MAAGDTEVVAVRRDPAVGAVALDVARLGVADARGAGRGIRRPRRCGTARAGRSPTRPASRTTLLTAGGPDNGWFPTPADRVQIAYGADSRVQSLLSVADASGSAAFDELAAMQAAWFFGANRAGEPMYDPATGITFDGIQPDGSINRNSRRREHDPRPVDDDRARCAPRCGVACDDGDGCR